MATGADDEMTDTSSDEPMDEKSKISFKSEKEELVQVMEVVPHMDKFHLSSGSGEEELTSKGTCDEKGTKLRKAAGNGRSKKGKKAKSDPQAEIEELKREKRKLEEEIKKLKEKVDNFEEAQRTIEAEREEGEEQLRWKHQKLTDEISKSAIFTNRVHYLQYSDSRSVGVIQHLEKHPAAKPVATRSLGGPGEANGVLRSANRNTCGTKRKKGSCRWRIDLGKNLFLLITHCSLHQNPQDPRRGKWELNGSIDGKEWKVLERKRLEIGDRCTTWSVQNETTAFRYFKILQKGVNQAGKVRFGIFRSRVELYGTLIEVKHVEEIFGRSLEESKSKPVGSLLQHENSLQKVCEALDTSVPGCGNYREVAQHYGFDHYAIESTLRPFNGGPSRALIEFLAASKLNLTVQEFAVVIEEKTKRKDVSRLLTKYDTAEEESL